MTTKLTRPEIVFNKNRLNPLAKSLYENFGRDKRGRRRGAWGKHALPSYNRADFIDEKACDDIIEYLAPSLEQHKGCTLIDVHPGACLFSQKMHDFLRPKWHLLMEPDERYESYFKPLVDRPGSRYCHTHLVGAHPKRYWESYRTVLGDPMLLPPRPALPIGDPKLRQFDPSLLVIGNLERTYASSKMELSLLLLHQLPNAALSNELFQRSGLVRMLWWIPERIKHQILTRSAMGRTSFSHGIEMGVEPVEVAGATSVQVLRDATMFSGKRPSFYDRINMEQVAKRMRDSGISPPEGRELLGIDYAEDVKVTDDLHKSPFKDKAVNLAEFQIKIDKVRDRIKLVRQATQAKRRAMASSIEYPQCEAVISRKLSRSNLSATRAPLFMDISLQIINLEYNYKNLEDTSVDKDLLDVLRTDILRLDTEMRDLINVYSDVMLSIIIDCNEEQIGFYMEPQHLPLDRRPFEPLKLSGSDVFPAMNHLALLDLMPKPRDLSVPDLADNKEGTRICTEMLQQLYSAKNRSVVEALNTFAVNAGQDLVPLVPAIYDVRKGGRMNPKMIRARMLTEEMVEGLVHAFFEWPFKPQKWELAVMGGQGSPADADSGGEGGGEGEAEGEEGEEGEAVAEE